MTLSSRPVRDFYRFSSTENDEIADSSQDIERQPISLRPLRRQHLSEPVQHTGTKTEWEPRFNELQKKYNDVSTYQLIQNLRATSFDVVRESLSVLRLRCGKDKNENEDRDVLIGQNGVDVLIQVIRTYPDTSLVNDALCVLTNISALDTSYTLTVAHSGFLDLFPSFLASPSPDIVNQALWTLSHIAADSANLREFILLNKSIVPALEPLISLDNPHLPYVLFCSSEICGSKLNACPTFKDALRVVQQLSSNNPSDH
ncbi:hypothetical protein BLNAU_25225 [Blattamonas nauphoetae]|uniref:Armadillo repeat-containing protein n=1 Tax=Blattamonas nauphoetae TaxID=2049346 RepID=A0ABQ9WMY9_9EUKA|nr:hypothetical protein BLNAU_25225 [Blattamonas nauphoetae]